MSKSVSQEVPLGTRAMLAIKVKRDQLPLSCPETDSVLWSQHPKVYLPIEATGTAVCPYCSKCYELVE